MLWLLLKVTHVHTGCIGGVYLSSPILPGFIVLDHHAVSQVRALFAPIHKDGYKFVAIAAAATIAAFLISSTLGFLILIVTLALIFFFRDPQRVVPVGDGLIAAPADGTIIGIEIMAPPAELGLGSVGRTRVSIFLSLFDVHVIRTPVSGRVSKTFHRPGLYLNAAAPEAPAQNECFGVAIHMKDTLAVGAVLIAGKVARRIVTSIDEGDTISAGERIGIIRLGSRVDIYLPAACCLLVSEGQKTIAGETVLADLNMQEPRRLFQRI
jgi:phosphatidylserine decarboxylase